MIKAISNIDAPDKYYDCIFITSTPSFYKINLFNKISETKNIFVVFLGNSSVERSSDFMDGNKYFDHTYLNDGDFEKRFRFRSVVRLIFLLRRLSYRAIGVGGWNLPESWVGILYPKSVKKFICQESSIFESKLRRSKLILKKIFIRFLDAALVSGLPHQRLMEYIGFCGKIYITGGVGLPCRKKPFKNEKKKFSGKFLFVGRLSAEKNLALIVPFFSRTTMAEYQLTIVGSGPQLGALREMAAGAKNIHFIPHVKNIYIDSVYMKHDIFILPSLSEPWGLVVEEALYYGLPIVGSSSIGCIEDLVYTYNSGISFDPESEISLHTAIKNIITGYEEYSNSARSIDFYDRDVRQVDSYLSVLDDG